MRKIPIKDGKLVCRGSCVGQTELVIDIPFSDEYKLTLLCPKCGSNWRLIPDEFIEKENKWKSSLDRINDKIKKFLDLPIGTRFRFLNHDSVCTIKEHYGNTKLGIITSLDKYDNTIVSCAVNQPDDLKHLEVRVVEIPDRETG